MSYYTSKFANSSDIVNQLKKFGYSTKAIRYAINKVKDKNDINAITEILQQYELNQNTQFDSDDNDVDGKDDEKQSSIVIIGRNSKNQHRKKIDIPKFTNEKPKDGFTVHIAIDFGTDGV
eukprot:406221_1